MTDHSSLITALLSGNASPLQQSLAADIIGDQQAQIDRLRADRQRAREQAASRLMREQDAIRLEREATESFNALQSRFDQERISERQACLSIVQDMIENLKHAKGLPDRIAAKITALEALEAEIKARG